MTESSRPRRFSRAYWRRVIVANVAAAVAVTVFYSGISLRTPPRQMLEAFAISMLFSTIIGPMLGIVMPRVGRAAACRFSFPFDWVVLLATMVAIALAGSFTAILILAAIGYLHGAGIVATWMAGSVKASIAITLTFGIFLTVVEGMRRQLDDARMALRTKERDEALARQQAVEAQLAALEARVQPHFLFNTLNSIAALIPEDAEGAERMVERVATLMRSSLQSDGPSTAPLGDELRLVRDYLEIERVRFRERLRYELRVAPELERVAVPRLSVQTLAENAVKYAVAPQRAGATIVIAAAMSDGRASVTVSDDGPGFAGGVSGDGHGLRLLRSRLATLFGDEGSLRIESRPGATSCVMEVPVR
jgi:LytS/YehU family sensor histidine kinase